MIMNWFDTYCAKTDEYRIYTLPSGEDLYLVPVGNSNALFCGLDKKPHPFPDALGIKNGDKILAEVEMLSGKFEKFKLYTWDSYILTYWGKEFLKIASVSRHDTYEIAKL
jgi:hypothetical protein